MKARQVLIAMAGLIIGAAVQADVYQWHDENGVVHYSDNPPDGVEAVLVPVESRATDRTRIESQKKESIGRQQAQMLIKQEADAEAADREAAQAENDAARAEACKKAQDRLFEYEHSRRLYRDLGNGEREWYTDEEVASAREAARQAVEAYCD
jgi:hypothetical protein